MRKFDERNDPASCFNKALENEVLFVLLARDAAAPAAIRAWIEARIALGINSPGERKLIDAEKTAREMTRQFRERDFS